MKVLLTGATGMVGGGVLRECLLDADVAEVVTLGRRAAEAQSPKLRQIVHADLTDLSSIEGQLAGMDACFFCLGVTSVGKSEEEYRRLTYDLTMSVARTLQRLNPGMTFVYVSGMNTDGTERGSTMWARVKGKTENDLMSLFPSSYMFRPGYIQPLHGVNTKTAWYNALYAVLAPLYPVWKRLFPGYVTTTECVGRAMLRVAKRGWARRVMEVEDINAACATA